MAFTHFIGSEAGQSDTKCSEFSVTENYHVREGIVPYFNKFSMLNIDSVAVGYVGFI
jgi:hypothetical protein